MFASDGPATNLSRRRALATLTLGRSVRPGADDALSRQCCIDIELYNRTSKLLSALTGTMRLRGLLEVRLLQAGVIETVTTEA